MGKIEKLEWDSDFFGYKVGKTTEKYLNSQDLSEYRLIYLYSDIIIDDIKEELVDQKATFIYQLTKSERDIDQFSDILIQPFNNSKHKYNELLSLTLESGIYSRFFRDKNFCNNEFQKLYKIWIDNSLKKTNAIDVFVAVKENSILGFITLVKITSKLAAIGLIAVCPEARGEKIATRLIQFLKKEALYLNFEQIQVVTQLDNMPATKLYKSNGFRLKEVKYIYHIWNNNPII